MKILIISTYDLQAGAGRCAYRLMEGLREISVDADLLALNSNSKNPHVINLDGKWIKFGNKLNLFEKPDRLAGRFYQPQNNISFSAAETGALGLEKKIAEINPDLIHLHWFQGGFMRPETMLSFNCPIVWTMHDMWPFTGGCHYDKHCGRYKENCGTCPILNSEKEKDLSRRIYNRKSKVINKLDSLSIIGSSRWLTNCGKESSLFQGLRVENIPTGLDMEFFKPIDKKVARQLLNLPQDKKLVLFGAMSATSDERKGYKYLRQALNKIETEGNTHNIATVVFGGAPYYSDSDLKIPQYHTGHLYDNVSLVTLYSAADVMVVPSVQENLANTIIESTACGTPVVAFDIGGNGDMIKHQTNGYLAKPLDVDDLANGISWVVDSDERSQKLSQNAREYASKHFELKHISQLHKTFYEELIDNYKSSNQYEISRSI